MKTRSGWVSNSSSSSFIICGARMTPGQFQKYFNISKDLMEEYEETYCGEENFDTKGVDFQVIDGEAFYVGNQIHQGDGFYGDYSVDLETVTRAMEHQSVKDLKAAGFSTKIWVCQTTG